MVSGIVESYADKPRVQFGFSGELTDALLLAAVEFLQACDDFPDVVDPGRPRTSGRSLTGTRSRTASPSRAAADSRSSRRYAALPPGRPNASRIFSSHGGNTRGRSAYSALAVAVSPKATSRSVFFTLRLAAGLAHRESCASPAATSRSSPSPIRGS